MKLDQKRLNRLLGMNDEQLGAVIQKIAAESGIDPAQLGINASNLQSIREALGSATEEDLKKMNIVYDEYKQNRRRK